MISVIIPTYNYGEFVSYAIKSVLCQTYQDFELIIVDDGSTDNTKEIVQEFVNSDKRIRYLYQKNRGLSSARNTGIKASRGMFIAFLDADDIWFPEKLEYQMEIMKNIHSIGLVGCGYINFNYNDGNTQIIIPDQELDLARELTVKNAIYGSASGVLVKKECFERVGLFDEKLKAAEDWDMWLRIIKHYDIRFVDKPMVKIRIHNRNMSKNVERMRNAQIQVLRKNIKGFMNKIKTFSYIHLDASREYCYMGNKEKALINIIKAICIYPFHTYKMDDKYSIFMKILIPSAFWHKLSHIKEYYQTKIGHYKMKTL
ncbi:MAG: glycosyltransferase family 2 protein [bacterium]